MNYDKILLRTPTGELKPVDYDKISKMSIPQFLEIENRLHNVRRNRYHDTYVAKAGTLVTAEHKAKLFRKGIDEETSYANSAADKYKKTYVHTNMLRNGEFDSGSLVIVTNLEVEMVMTPGKPTAQASGIITNPKSTFTDATADAALISYAWLNQTVIRLIRGRQIICEGLAINFPQKAGLSGQLGGSKGGFTQNNVFNARLMANPQVFEHDDDFEIEVLPQANFDLTSDGINREISMKVVLDCIEAVRIYT